MIRSMTGFGHADGTVGSATIAVEIKTVNHRFFSPSIKLPPALGRWEIEIRDALRQAVARGHVTLQLRMHRAEQGGAGIDHAKFGAAVEQLRALHDRYALGGSVDLAAVLRMPDVIAVAREDETEAGTVEEVMTVVGAALSGLAESRREEGARLAAVIDDRVNVIERALDRMATRAPARVVAHRDRLRAAVRELADGIALDESRLAQEIAVLADRLDISEEIDRFRSHIQAFRSATSATSGEPVGKRLGFLLQEMLRETNTSGSKGADAELLHEVVTIKEELERIREQVENLE